MALSHGLATQELPQTCVAFG